MYFSFITKETKNFSGIFHLCRYLRMAHRPELYYNYTPSCNFELKRWEKLAIAAFIRGGKVEINF